MVLILLLILFFLEISAFVEIGGEIGVFSTLLLIVFSAMFGLGRLRYYTSYVARSREQNQKQAANHLFHGICGLLAGLLLVIPGFVTDGIGLLLLIPFVRVFLRTFILDTIIGSYTFGLVDSEDLHDMKNYYKDDPTNKNKEKSTKKTKVVEAEFEVVDEDNDKA